MSVRQVTRQVFKPNQQGVPTREKRRLYNSTQIRAVLASKQSIPEAAAAAGVAFATAKAWRQGQLPQWFVDEERERAKLRRAAAAARFVNPADARFGR